MNPLPQNAFGLTPRALGRKAFLIGAARTPPYPGPGWIAYAEWMAGFDEAKAEADARIAAASEPDAKPGAEPSDDVFEF